jgi:hypothetical protein
MSQQKQKGAGGDPFGSQEEEQLKVKPLELKVPDVHEVMKMAGAKDVVLDSQGRKTDQGREQASGRDGKRRDKRYRLLCCCGVRGCGIGPFTKTEEAD